MFDHSSDLSRRKFMAASLGCLASAGLTGLTAESTVAQDSSKVVVGKKTEIIYRTLGRTGLKVPVVSMGVANCNDPGLVKEAFELGVRLFDTAANYQFGRNEQLVGNVLKQMGVRDKAIIGTKVHTPDRRTGLDSETARKKVIDSTEGCLRRLKTDYIDIMYIHDVQSSEAVADSGAMEALATLKKQGKVRFTGISTHQNTTDVINAITDSGFWDVVLTTMNFTLADDTNLLSAISKAAAKGIGIVAMKTQAGGARFPNPDTLREYDSQTINTAALKWVLRNENIATAIPGFGNYQYLREDFPVAFNLEYADQEKKFLSDNSIKLSMGFCRQCRKCLATCPGGADIPTLMRIHMYAVQYSNFQLARTTLSEIPKKNNLQACVSCDECMAQCANSVDIPRKIDELKTIYA